MPVPTPPPPLLPQKGHARGPVIRTVYIALSFVLVREACATACAKTPGLQKLGIMVATAWYFW